MCSSQCSSALAFVCRPVAFDGSPQPSNLFISSSPPHSSSPPSSLLCPWVRCSSLPSPPLPGAVQEGPDDQERHPPPSHHGHHPRVRRQDAHGREELDRGGHRLLRRLQELRRGRCTEEDTVPQVRMSRRRRVWGWRQERRTQCLK